MTRAQGIDVSDWEPVRDWDAVYGAGVRFVGVKATEGNSFVAKTLRAHRDELRRRPFALGIFYHFARSGSAVKQAERFIDAVGPLRPNERLCLDLEAATPTPDDPRRALGWIEEFYDTLMGNACGDRRVLLYTSNRIWQKMGDPDWALAREVDLWAPRYSHAEPVVPKPWAKIGWTFWQCSDGKDPEPVETPGVGHCDRNVFRGDDAALAAYAGGKS